MSQIIQNLNGSSDAWMRLMGAILWQSALLVGLIALVALLLRRASPVVRYWLWQIVAIKLLLMPFWTLAIPLPSWAGGVPGAPSGSRVGHADVATVVEPPEHGRAAPDGPSAPVDVRSAGSEADRAQPIEARAGDRLPSGPSLWQRLGELTWQSWLAIGWLAVVVLQLVRLLWQRVRLGRLLRRAAPAGAELASLVRTLAERLGLRRGPSIALIDADCPLFICGLRRPVLVLSRSLAASLERSRLQQVILHELAHLKRHDLLWGWTAELGRVLYFFNPIVHWVCCRLRLERELACDQLAMALSGGTPADYAQTLIHVVGHDSRPALC
jgi:beta-lactamase regulating signal transducer with metallopeptidase domain